MKKLINLSIVLMMVLGLLPTRTASASAGYAGSANYLPVSDSKTFTINNADPFIAFTSLTSSLNPSVFGDTVTFTAVVSTSGGVPTGKVIFVELVLEGWNFTQILLGEDTTAASLGGDLYEYTFSTSTLAVGYHAIIAGYDDGSETFPTSGDPITQTVVEQIWPIVTITSAPPEISYSTQATFEFSSDTDGTVFECSLNDGDVSNAESWTWSVCSSPQVYTGLNYVATYGFAVKAQGAPITPNTMAWHQWYILLPQVTITGGPAEAIESTEAILTFSSNPAGVDLECYLVTQEYGTQNPPTILEDWAPCTSPRTFSNLSRGYAYYFGVKPKGAADYYAATRQWMITRLTLSASPNPSESGSNVTFTATLWDDSGTVPGGSVSFAEMVNQGFGVVMPVFFGQSSSPTASGPGWYAYVFSTSALGIGSHEIIVLYTDEGGTITSLPITQEVTEVTAQAPVVTTQPANRTACAGSSVSFAAAASGTPVPTVQWQVSNDSGTTWNNISGATSTTYAFTAAAGDNGKRYRAVFTNSAGSATSSAAILTVNTAPVVTTQPANQTVTYGVTSVTFSAAASGTSPSIQWRRSTNGTTWEVVSGATNSNLTIANPTVQLSGIQYRAEFSNVCGTATSSAATLTVNKAETTTTVSCPANVTYNGSAQAPCTAAVTGPGGLNTSLTVTYQNNINAGTATASASYAGGANYLSSSDSKTFTIGKAATTTVVTCPASVTYDGSAQSPCTAAVTGPGGLNTSLTVTYQNNVNAGTATASASYAGGANYLSSSDSKTFTIGKAATTTVVTCPASVTYDGSAQAPCTASVAGPGGLNQTLTVLYQNNINAGTATASASYAEGANWLTSSDSKTFTIDKAETTTTVTCPASVTYDGLAQSPCTASVTGPGGLNTSLTVTYQNNINAGTATASASYAGGANYLSSSDSKTFTIDKAETTTTVACPASVTYDGSAQSPCTAAVTGPGALNTSLTVTYQNNVNAGTATASASYAGSANYLSSSDSKTFTIDKAETTTTVTCPANVTYNGSAQAPCTASVTGPGGLEETLSVTYQDNINAGTATASASYAGGANWLPSSNSKTFTIDKATLTVTADNQTAQYSDAAPTLTFQYGSFQGSDDADDINNSPSCSTTRLISSPAGVYPIICSGGEDNNYTFSYVNGTFTVTKENAIVTFDDGNPAALMVSTPEGPLNANGLTLVLKVREILPDLPAVTAIAGNIDNAGLIVTLEPLSGGGAITLNCTAAVVGTGYDGVKTFTCTNSQPIPVDTYDVVATIDGNYYIGVGYDGFTVFDPSLGYATGGGWFYWPGTTEKTNFGFTMKYNKKATNVQGNLLVIRHHADGTISRLKSNALDGLALKDNNGCGIASFSGKATYETWDPDANEGIGGYVTTGGNRFSVYVEDCNEPGTGVDRFWVRSVDMLVMDKNASTNAVKIGGGNIAIPHKPK